MNRVDQASVIVVQTVPADKLAVHHPAADDPGATAHHSDHTELRGGAHERGSLPTTRPGHRRAAPDLHPEAVTGDLGLPVVLQRIVEAARDLVGARYAALGVIAPDGGLAEFVHVGMPQPAVEAIGYLPQGKGIAGPLDGGRWPTRGAAVAAIRAADIAVMLR